MFKKLLMALGLLAAGGVAGWYLGKNPSYRQDTAAKSHAVTETRTVTTRQPGGVVTIDKTVKRVENREETKHVPPPAKPDYSVGVAARLRNIDDVRRPTLDVTAGRRLLGDLWLEVGTTEKLDEVRVGIRLDF